MLSGWTLIYESNKDYSSPYSFFNSINFVIESMHFEETYSYPICATSKFIKSSLSIVLLNLALASSTLALCSSNTLQVACLFILSLSYFVWYSTFLYNLNKPNNIMPAITNEPIVFSVFVSLVSSFLSWFKLEFSGESEFNLLLIWVSNLLMFSLEAVWKEGYT